MAEAAMAALKRRLDAEEEARVAELITRNLEAVSRRAQEKGYLAYRQPPSPERQARPNERFLLSTIRGVNYANRKADIDEMWELRRLQQEREGRRPEERGPPRSRQRAAGGGLFARELGRVQQQQQRQQGRGQGREEGESTLAAARSTRQDRGTAAERRRAPCSPSPAASLTQSESPATSASSGGGAGKRAADRSGQASGGGTPPGGMTDEDLAAMLSQRQVRGRGAVGTRVDEPGPFLPPEAAAEYCEEAERDPLLRPAQRLPERPLWLPRDPELSQRDMLAGPALPLGGTTASVPGPALPVGTAAAAGVELQEQTAGAGRKRKAEKVKKGKRSKKHRKEKHRKEKVRRTEAPD